MASKAEKKNLKVYKFSKKTKNGGDIVQVDFDTNIVDTNQIKVPLYFKGTMENNDKGCIYKGNIRFPKYMYCMIMVAALLIVARLTWSVYNWQVDNIILCGIVIALLLVMVIVIVKKTKSTKQTLIDFLSNLNKK